MSLGRARKILNEKRGFTFLCETNKFGYEREQYPGQFKKLWAHVGRNKSTLSKDGEDPERIKS
jgi:hypothetical protein